jgi:two-component system chemotaxis sensor kinase CheA
MSQTSNDADQDFIAAAMPAFISEAVEQTEAIETLLLELEEQPNDRELLDSLFRCAHTVKGSAGIFGLNKVVEFTHHVETLLDQMREGVIVLGPELSTLLLECNDQIKFLVATASDESADTPEQKDTRADLVIQLRALTEAPTRIDAVAAQIASPAPGQPDPGALTRWTISARFGQETFRNGMDPLSIARYLSGMGQVLGMRCGIEAVPSLANLNPETCYLSFGMELESKASRDDVEGAFSFVADDCELNVIAPETPGQKLARQIEEMPETPRLGDLLVSVGAVTQDRLVQVLTTQLQSRGMPATPKAKLGDLLETQAGVAPEAVEAALGKQQKLRETSTGEEGRYIRVQADRLDAVINLLGELVIAGAGATLLARETRQSALLKPICR